MAKRTLQDTISRQIFSEIFPPVPSKSDRRRQEIIDGAITAYASIDYEHISYDDIAQPARTSRRLVQHYFPDKNELFLAAMKMVRARYQLQVIEAMKEVNDPLEKFEAYVRSAISWPRYLPDHVKAWFLYYLVCAQQPRLRKIHEDLALMGEERICALLTEAFPRRKWNESRKHLVAKTTQRLITGALIEICSETSNPGIDRIQSDVIQALGALIESP